MGGRIDHLPGNNQQKETSTDKIQKKSAKEVKENFQSLNISVIDANIDILKKKDPVIKRILDLPELQDLKLDRVNIDNGSIFISGYTDFSGNLYQLLHKNGIPKHSLESFRQEGVRVKLYGSSLQFFIKQYPLSK